MFRIAAGHRAQSFFIRNRIMILTVKRKYKKEGYTIGELWVEGSYFCDTLEPTDRGLTRRTPLKEIAEAKEKGATAIPEGRYQVSLNMMSPRFAKTKAYANCEGKVPRLINVPGFSGILIHIGNWAENTRGCILVGRNVVKGGLLYSTQAFHALYAMMKDAKESVWVEITS